MNGKKNSIGCYGYCSSCKTNHILYQGRAKDKASELFRKLQQQERIDIFTPESGSDDSFGTAGLFGEQRGKMFGVLECRNNKGKTVWLYAFSGQFNTHWLIKGWAPPLFDIPSYHALHDPIERRIKELSRKIDHPSTKSEEKNRLKIKRRTLSKSLMRDIHNLYRVANFHGKIATLNHAFLNTGGKPTGTGDCCAPKLLNQAALSNLVPLSLAEFFFGRNNRSDSKKNGMFYQSCNDKCQPLLGYMLCGIDERIKQFENNSRNPLSG